MRFPLTALTLAGAFCTGGNLTAHAANVFVDLGQTGSNQSFPTTQPSLGLMPVVQTTGTFDQLGEIWWFGGNFAPRGTAQAAGQLLTIEGNSALFSRIGTAFGGDGRTTFALPDLRGRTPIGSSSFSPIGRNSGSGAVTLGEENLPLHSHETDTGPSDQTGRDAPDPFENRQPSLAVNYALTTLGVFPPRAANPPAGAAAEPAGSSQPGDAFIGAVSMTASFQGLGSTTVGTNGQLLPIDSNPALFSILGTTYGGDGRTTFGVPDLSGRAAVGEGTGPGLTTRSLGQKQGDTFATLTNATMPPHAHADPDFRQTAEAGGGGGSVNSIQPELALNYVIALAGIFPSRSANAPFASSAPQGALGVSSFLGEIGIFAGNFAPRGWALAHGQILNIAENDALFSLLGTTFGGDGRTTFALPDLRGRVPVGLGQAPGLADIRWGQRFGSEVLQLSSANLPSHGHTITRVAPIPLPAGVWLLLGGLGGLSALRRR